MRLWSSFTAQTGCERLFQDFRSSSSLCTTYWSLNAPCSRAARNRKFAVTLSRHGVTSTKLLSHPSFRRSLSKSRWQRRTLRNLYISSKMRLRRTGLACSLKLTLLKLQRTLCCLLKGIILCLAHSAVHPLAGRPCARKLCDIRKLTRLSHILAASAEFSLFTDLKNILYMLLQTRFNANV